MSGQRLGGILRAQKSMLWQFTGVAIGQRLSVLYTVGLDTENTSARSLIVYLPDSRMRLSSPVAKAIATIFLKKNVVVPGRIWIAMGDMRSSLELFYISPTIGALLKSEILQKCSVYG